ncbi:MAG: N-acetyltransferase [Balneolaceae bacterium]|nr:N-acetyltransferase [Balneolaceae bacterium]
MIDRLTVRPEKVQDIERINQIIRSAFKEISYSNQKEHLLVSDLRQNNALTLSLVAERDNEILGHIAFSEVTIDDKFMFWYGLAPVSVDPEYQNQGVGSTLIEYWSIQPAKAWFQWLRIGGRTGLLQPFGFQHQNNLTCERVLEEYFLMQSFNEEIPSGRVKYHQLFKKYG